MRRCELELKDLIMHSPDPAPVMYATPLRANAMFQVADCDSEISQLL